ncbi:hypothetical protein I3843_04G080500 [Carya illinoinensis]|nr:hypothetical protein I3843_04G080500 [Carya illinoinensis]
MKKVLDELHVWSLACWIRGGLGGLVLVARPLCCAAWLGVEGMVQVLSGMARAWLARLEWCRWHGLVLLSMDWCCARAGARAWSCTWLWSGQVQVPCRCCLAWSGAGGLVLSWAWRWHGRCQCMCCLVLAWLVSCMC